MAGPYHPLFIHFPIALYCLGLLLTAGYLWRRAAEGASHTGPAKRAALGELGKHRGELGGHPPHPPSVPEPGPARSADYERFAYWSFFLGWLAAIVASLVGLVDRGQLGPDDPRLAALDQHITQGVLFMIFSGLVVYYRFRWPDVLTSSRRWQYFGLLALGAITLAATGYLGGELVYGLRVGVR